MLFYSNGTVLVSSDGSIERRRSKVCSQTPSGGQNTLRSIRVGLIRRNTTCNDGSIKSSPDDLHSERFFMLKLAFTLFTPMLHFIIVT